MNRKLLESYRSNKRLIERNRKKILDEGLKDLPVIRGKVKGSSSEFPYIERHFSVEMDEPIEADKSNRRVRTWKKEIEKAEKEIEEVERYIQGIGDVRDREVFTYRYMDGMKAQDVGMLIGYTKGRISQIISKYVKD